MNLTTVFQVNDISVFPVFKGAIQPNMLIGTELHFTEVRFASFLSGGFITDIVLNPPERKLQAKLTSVQCTNKQSDSLTSSGHIEQ